MSHIETAVVVADKKNVSVMRSACSNVQLWVEACNVCKRLSLKIDCRSSSAFFSDVFCSAESADTTAMTKVKGQFTSCVIPQF